MRDASYKAIGAAAAAVAIIILGIPSHALQAAPGAIAAKTSARRVIVSLPDRKLALLKDGQIMKIYHVAIGKSSSPSPVGEFKIANRVTNPTYYHRGQVVPAGKDNPVGSRWMGLNTKGYGIHGTNQPHSIGKAASSGCIRMGQRDLEELFAMVEVGDAVEIRAERDEQVAAIFGLDTGVPADDQPTTADEASGGGQ